MEDYLIYEPKMIQRLLTSYLLQPEAVSAMRAHLMLIDDETGLLPYEKWIKQFDGCVGEKSMQLICTGGAGALYPAKLFKDVKFDKEAILENCLYADDIWLKIIEAIAGIPVVVACPYVGLKYIQNSQDERLYDYNYANNDVQISESIRWVDAQYGEGYFIDQLTNPQNGRDLNTVSAIKPFYEKKYNGVRERLSYIESTKGYKIMKPVTLFVRSIKEFFIGYKHNHVS